MVPPAAMITDFEGTTTVASARHDEVERKYDVAPGTAFPTLTGLQGVFTKGRPVEQDLEAVYFDTVAFDLARQGATLRRRTGGDDAGWHLKLPKRKDTRTEWQLPLGRATKTVPERLLAPVRSQVRDRKLVPVVRVHTRRLEHTLLDADGRVLARVCDDEVHSEPLDGSLEPQTWREWEVELIDGHRALLDEVEKQLVSAGAMPTSMPSKLARSLGDAIADPPNTTADLPSRKKLAQGSAAQLLRSHLVDQVAQLHAQDARLRTEEPGSVHKLRIAARRLRSTLKTYKPLLEPGAPDSLGEELRWLGQCLADARDAQVLRERLHDLVDAEPAELVLGPVRARIDHELTNSYRTGLERAHAALDSDRYFRLLDALDDLVATAPLTAEADTPAKKLLPHLLQRDAKRLRRAVGDVTASRDAARHDAALHEARKKAKRMRYSAESAVPVLGKRAKKLAALSKHIQEALGEHQDAVVSRIRLCEYGVQAHLAGENGFTFGRLHALEQARADQSEREFRSAWKALPVKKLTRWMRT